MSEPHVIYEKRGHIARITLNRPEVHNAFSPESIVRLADIWQDFNEDDDLRVALITGAGERAFCSGADLGRLIPLYTRARAPEDEWDHRLLDNPATVSIAFLRRYTVYKPIVSAVNGFCLAGGTELVLATDIRIAAEHATFALTEAKRGLVPGAGSMARLPRQVPYCKAAEILLVGDHMTAPEAHRIGLVNEVVPAADLMPRAEEFAAKLAGNGPLAVRKIKEAMLRGSGLLLPDAFAIEDEISRIVFASEDAREGPRAFMEKRKPEFTGR
jgi:enoyl-CoA hydratase